MQKWAPLLHFLWGWLWDMNMWLAWFSINIWEYFLWKGRMMLSFPIFLQGSVWNADSPHFKIRHFTPSDAHSQGQNVCSFKTMGVLSSVEMEPGFGTQREELILLKYSLSNLNFLNRKLLTVIPLQLGALGVWEKLPIFASILDLGIRDLHFLQILSSNNILQDNWVKFSWKFRF